MIRRAWAVGLAVLALLCLRAAATVPSATATPDFATRILPILTKAGCNMGTCHGAAIGQGGFRLSLLGYDAEADYAAITREFEGRRVDPGAPDASLLLRKATMQEKTPHGGGQRFAPDSASYRTLRAWIAAGVPYGDGKRRVASLVVTPADVLLPGPGQSRQIRVTAVYSDGAREDVTPLALYTSNDEALATVTPAGRVTVRDRGMATVMVRYLGQVAAVRIGAPLGTAPIPDAAFPPRNFVDAAVFAELKRLRIPPAPPADDAEFLRRVTLDLIGTLPTAEEVRAFQKAPPSPRKRQAAIDALLKRPEFVDYWTLKLADLLLINAKRLGDAPAKAYHAWLRGQVAQNTPLDRVVRDLLTAEGDVNRSGAASFYRLVSDPRDMSEYVSRTFLGVRVQCARCHNHPFDRWTQTDYHRWAALFARVRYDGGSLVVAERGEIQHPKTGKDVTPLVLGGAQAVPPAQADRRTPMAAWLTSPQNPLFARAMANRVWKHLMGRGIVEPVDDIRVTNPPSNPALLAALGKDFAKDFDLRRLVRTIASSRTYQLSSRTNAVNRRDDRLFSHAYLKPLAAQVLADALAQATGVPTPYPGQPPGTRAVQIADVGTESYTLDVFGRCGREANCEMPSAFGGGMSQALHLLNGPVVNGKLRGGILDRLFAENQTEGQVVEALHLRTLSRFPTLKESAHWTKTLRDAADRREAAEDLLWALLNAREFAFNH